MAGKHRRKTDSSESSKSLTARSVSKIYWKMRSRKSRKDRDLKSSRTTAATKLIILNIKKEKTKVGVQFQMAFLFIEVGPRGGKK